MKKPLQGTISQSEQPAKIREKIYTSTGQTVQTVDVADTGWRKYELDMRRQRDELTERTAQLEMERANFQKYVGDREKQLNSEADAMRRELAERISQQEEQRDQDRKRTSEMIAEARSRMVEASKKLSEVEEERKKLEADKLQYDEANNKRLQAESVVFVTGVVSDLKKREESLSKVSFWWSVGGGISLLLATIPAGITITHSAIWPNASPSWPGLIMQTIKSSVFIALAAIIARYAFLLSKRYLHESLKVSETIHGVSFGQLYVQSYGATAGWDQVKDAFSKWHLRPEDTASEENEGSEEVWVKGLDADTLKHLVEIFKKLKE